MGAGSFREDEAFPEGEDPDLACGLPLVDAFTEDDLYGGRFTEKP